jgi:DNA-binding CsgD family transcriptional regulator
VASAVRAAVTELGYVIDERAFPALCFVGLGGLDAVANCRLRRRPAAPAGPLVVGYTLRAPLAAALHRAHGCADSVLVLDVAAGGARFRHLCWPDVLARAGLTCREADVLALLLTRRTNAEIARQLVVADTTVRAHCRSVLRKLEVPHRRALWSRAEAEWSVAGVSGAAPDPPG